MIGNDWIPPIPSKQTCCSSDEESLSNVRRDGTSFSYKRKQLFEEVGTGIGRSMGWGSGGRGSSNRMHWNGVSVGLPHNPTADDDIVAQTAKDLNALSIEDRSKVLEEVHGVACAVEENPELVSNCLRDLEEQIERSRLDKSAYHLAMALRPQLKTDTKFKLMFLRADMFNCKTAARRIIKYFESKRLLFGEEKLVKQITYDDLDEDDKESLLTGAFQILPSKDQTGRSILFSIPKQYNAKSWKNEFRSSWYAIMRLVEQDETAQKQGIVFLGYYIGCQTLKHGFLTAMNNIHILNEALPTRMGGAHFCYDISHIRPLALFTQRVIGRENRLRFRAHYGSDVECQYKLMTFGIPQSILPVDTSGNFRQDLFLSWTRDWILRENGSDLLSEANGFLKGPGTAETIYEQEEEVDDEVEGETNNKTKQNSNSSSVVIYDHEILNTDILLGRGERPLHPANLKLSGLIHAARNKYHAASKFEKTCISMSLVDEMKKGGGRFLKRRDKGSDEWIEANALEARKSVIQRFRQKGPIKSIAL